MKVYTLNKVGALHTTHTEDYIFHTNIGKQWFVGAVMDGCSSGKESFFASGLYGKIISNACHVFPFLSRLKANINLEKIEAEFIGNFILNHLFEYLKKTRDLLNLETAEMLTTLIITVFNKMEHTAWVNISGDGLVVHNDEIMEIDHKNTPDYMAYYLEKDFENWYKNHSISKSFNSLHNLSISTDGICKLYSKTERRQKTIDPIHYILIDAAFAEQPDMLNIKFNILEKDHGLIAFDDLGIIRLII